MFLMGLYFWNNISSFLSGSFARREGHTHEFMRQSKHGPLMDSQPMVYRCDMHVLEVCHVRVDFYEVGREAEPSIPPLYFAYALIAGTLLKGSSGRVTVPIRMPARQEVLRVTDCGEVTLNFTIAKALPRCFKTGRPTLHRPWQLRFKKDLPVLHIGHRGNGPSYSTQPAEVCENTIESFNAAAEAGADFVEMDVMLDVDMTPVSENSWISDFFPCKNHQCRVTDVLWPTQPTEPTEHTQPCSKIKRK